jgi:hypothetical protein
MPLERLSPDDLALLAVTEKATPEYLAFVQRMLPGDGGRAIVATEGITRQAIRNRLDAAAAYLGTELEYLPAGKGQVVFVAVHVSTAAMAGKQRPLPAAQELGADRPQSAERPARESQALADELSDLIGLR